MSNIGKEVFINCRAVKNCEGRKAILKFIHNFPAGGRLCRYQCLSCKRTFDINS